MHAHLKPTSQPSSDSKRKPSASSLKLTILSTQHHSSKNYTFYLLKKSYCKLESHSCTLYTTTMHLLPLTTPGPHMHNATLLTTHVTTAVSISLFQESNSSKNFLSILWPMPGIILGTSGSNTTKLHSNTACLTTYTGLFLMLKVK